ncbi:MAG: hypothetical protein Q7T59_06205 [Candidatus Woesebacteria bacterium]|nr:hypothetical protein [Candidatus Woesebacteria bacterium]
MTNAQNIREGRKAAPYDIARLIVQGLAGQRSSFASVDNWSGREWAAVMRAAEELAPLYEHGLIADELIGRAGRSMRDSYARH